VNLCLYEAKLHIVVDGHYGAALATLRPDLNLDKKRVRSIKSDNRQRQVAIARKNRRESKVSCADCNSYKVDQACAKLKLPPHIVFDPFFIKGGPLLMG
jgi:hypothetical protein